MKDINPNLPANVGGAGRGGPHILGEKKPTPPPWNPKECWKVVCPLDGDREYFVADPEDEDGSGVELTVGMVRVMNSYEATRNPDSSIKIEKHKTLCFIGVGVILEIVEKPSWWGQRDKK